MKKLFASCLLILIAILFFGRWLSPAVVWANERCVDHNNDGYFDNYPCVSAGVEACSHIQFNPASLLGPGQSKIPIDQIANYTSSLTFTVQVVDSAVATRYCALTDKSNNNDCFGQIQKTVVPDIATKNGQIAAAFGFIDRTDSEFAYFLNAGLQGVHTISIYKGEFTGGIFMYEDIPYCTLAYKMNPPPLVTAAPSPTPTPAAADNIAQLCLLETVYPLAPGHDHQKNYFDLTDTVRIEGKLATTYFRHNKPRLPINYKFNNSFTNKELTIEESSEEESCYFAAGYRTACVSFTATLPANQLNTGFEYITKLSLDFNRNAPGGRQTTACMTTFQVGSILRNTPAPTKTKSKMKEENNRRKMATVCNQSACEKGYTITNMANNPKTDPVHLACCQKTLSQQLNCQPLKPAGQKCAACILGEQIGNAKAPYPGKTGAWTALGCIRTDTEGFVQDLFSIILGIGGGIAFLLLLKGAYQILLSRGNQEAIAEGRQTITSAIAGLLIILFSVFILKVIGVDILNLPGFGIK